MPEKVRVGVAGTSWWADLLHLPALQSHPQAELAALCGRDRARAEEMARKYGAPKVFTDYRRMIEEAELDALVVSVPDDLHREMIEAGLEAGLHVVCEKPLARTLAEARRMYARAEAAGVKHMTFFTYRWLPHYRFLAELVDEGFIGPCYQAGLRMISGIGRDGKYAWRMDGRRGSGVLGDLGSHLIDMARFLVGDIRRVSAHLAVFVERPGPEGGLLEKPANDAALLALEFESGAQGYLQASAVAHVGRRGQEQQVVLHGRAGTLEAGYTLGGASVSGARQGERDFVQLPVPDRFWGEADRGRPFQVFASQPVGDRLFIDAILHDRPVVPSFYDGLMAQAVIEAAFESHRTGAWVEVPDPTGTLS